MILVVHDYDGLYGKFWGNLGMEVSTDVGAFMKEPEAFKLVCFTGGEDVSPKLYGHENLGSHNSESRDQREMPVFEMARKSDIPMTGICRGSQFLNVMCGGTMVQHLKKDHGGGRHECETLEGECFEVTSSHHQMSVVGPGGVYLGWSAEVLGIEDCVYNGNLEPQMLAGNVAEEREAEHFQVTEAFVYPRVNVFAVQHHPEWQDINCEAAQWTLRKIQDFCLKSDQAALSA